MKFIKLTFKMLLRFFIKTSTFQIVIQWEKRQGQLFSNPREM